MRTHTLQQVNRNQQKLMRKCFCNLRWWHISFYSSLFSWLFSCAELSGTLWERHIHCSGGRLRTGREDPWLQVSVVRPYILLQQTLHESTIEGLMSFSDLKKMLSLSCTAWPYIYCGLQCTMFNGSLNYRPGKNWSKRYFIVCRRENIIGSSLWLSIQLSVDSSLQQQKLVKDLGFCKFKCLVINSFKNSPYLFVTFCPLCIQVTGKCAAKGITKWQTVVWPGKKSWFYLDIGSIANK